MSARDRAECSVANTLGSSLVVESTASLGLFIAFGAGLLSFLSPCVLPLVPSYVTFITGMNLEDLQSSRRDTLVHALLFIAGFTLIFMALGAGATVFGQLMLRYRDVISRTGGVLIIIFGLYLLGVFNLSFLMKDTRLHLANKPLGYFGTVVVGIAFGAALAGILSNIAGLDDVTDPEIVGRAVTFIYAANVLPLIVAAFFMMRFARLVCTPSISASLSRKAAE